MNLQENYKRLFKGKARSNDGKLINESVNEAVARPNTILVTRMDNGNSDMQFPNGQELDSDMYADALAMAEEKYAMGTKIEFIYMDEAGKGHEGELELRGEGDYYGPDFEDGKNDNARDKALIDLFDDFR